MKRNLKRLRYLIVVNKCNEEDQTLLSSFGTSLCCCSVPVVEKKHWYEYMLNQTYGVAYT